MSAAKIVRAELWVGLLRVNFLQVQERTWWAL